MIIPSSMVLQAYYLILSLTWLGIHLVAGNAGHFLRQEHLTRDDKDYPNTQEPKGFGYSVRDSAQHASHFRQEQRDEKGVVRGSYGLQDQDGTFRLVRYIADEKGFRADITSNEPGVGNQSPASVSVSRFLNTQARNKETSPPESSRSNGNNPDRTHDFFRFNKQAFDDKNEPVGESGPLDLRKYLTNYPFIDDEAKQEPPSSGVLWKDYNGNVYGSQNPTKTNADGGKKSNAENPNEHTPWYRSDSFKSKSSQPSWPSPTRETDNPANTPRLRTSVQSVERMTPGVLDILLKQPQQKVHRNLPDCGTVNSNVLCKPPPVYNLQRNASEEQSSFMEDSKNTDSFMSSGLDSMKQIIETTFADRLYKFSLNSDESSPLRTSRINFASQNDPSKYFPSMKVSSKKKPCPEKNPPRDDNSDEDLSLTPAVIRPVIYNSISNTHINSYGENWRHLIPTNSANQMNRNSLPQPTLFSNGDISNYNVFNNKKLVLLTPHNTQEVDIPTLKLLERLNVLGFILLPQDGNEHGLTRETDPIKTSELSNKEIDNQEGHKSSDNNNNNNNPGKYSTSMLHNNQRLNFMSSKTTEESTSTGSSISGKEHSINEETLEPNEEINESLLISKPEQFLRSNNTEFLILDDGSKQDHDDSRQISHSESKNETETPVNWRKVLKDELNQEYKKTLKSKSGSSDSSDSNISGHSDISNERVFQIHDPPASLYDSRGVPIKSENVPLHLHRYIPPTGVTSLPWKFSIPRPGPPRSIALPQMPSTSS